LVKKKPKKLAPCPENDSKGKKEKFRTKHGTGGARKGKGMVDSNSERTGVLVREIYALNDQGRDKLN